MSVSLMTGYALLHGLRSDCFSCSHMLVTPVWSQARSHTKCTVHICRERNLVLSLLRVSVCYTLEKESIWLGFLHIRHASTGAKLA